tara:strand:- start:114 stop:452 length:339 start_codon:yes stop_codon:yes gene_type:complete
MASRPIRQKRFRLLDDIGIGEVCRLYVEEQMSVPKLCQHLFEPSKHGKVGVSIFYDWIKKREHRSAWDLAVQMKRELREEAIKKAIVQKPDIEWRMFGVHASVLATMRSDDS